MRLLLSSFGIGASKHDEFYFRMPPVSMTKFGPGFVPDYPLFLLADEIVVDRQTVDQLRDEQVPAAFGPLRDLINAIDSAGRLQLASFDRIAAERNRQIRQAVRYDLDNWQWWLPAINESFTRWEKFVDMAVCAIKEKQTAGESLSYEDTNLLSIFKHGSGCHLADFTWMDRRKPRDRYAHVHEVLHRYLNYISTNLCLADSLDAALHDWADLEPLYRAKLGLSLKRGVDSECIDQGRRLFDILCPDFKPRSPKALTKALNDPRIEDLRTLVRDAVAGKVTFDEEFANATLREVLNAERKAAQARRITGWATLPLGFIPWAGTPLQKAAEEVISRPLEVKARKTKSWFYLISDLAEGSL